LDERLESMWDSHHSYIRRFLIGLAYDIDLAEDLLQDTYLCAWKGISGYRGGDERAWLCAIARNAYLSHIRRACVRSEACSYAELHDGHALYAGSREHVDRLDFQNLLSKLPDDLRTALVMKHHMGMTYPEIARRTDCATITARMRVNRAIWLIRAALDENWKPSAPTCAGMSTNRILDYLFELLRPDSMETVEKHLRQCGPCRERVYDVRALVRALDNSAIRYRQMHLLDVDDGGVPSLHVTSSSHNNSDRPLGALSFRARSDYGVRALAIPGSRLGYDAVGAMDRPDLLHYTADLPCASPPGHDIQSLTTIGPLPSRRAVRTDCSTYRLDWDQAPSYTDSCSYVQAIHLPKGARFLSANPAPAEVISNGSTTLVWRASLLPAERFRSTVEYCLDS
jgi:RNA polymerase sigma-70 factor (ECF subfamily)